MAPSCVGSFCVIAFVLLLFCVIFYRLFPGFSQVFLGFSLFLFGVFFFFYIFIGPYYPRPFWDLLYIFSRLLVAANPRLPLC